MVKLVGKSQYSTIEYTFNEYKDAKIALFTNESMYPNYTWTITDMDDMSFLDLIHVEYITPENDLNLNQDTIGSLKSMSPIGTLALSLVASGSSYDRSERRFKFEQCGRGSTLLSRIDTVQSCLPSDLL